MVKTFIVDYSGFRIRFTVTVSAEAGTVRRLATFAAEGEIPKSPIDDAGSLTAEGRAREAILAADPGRAGGPIPLPFGGDVEPDEWIREKLAEAFVGASIEPAA